MNLRRRHLLNWGMCFIFLFAGMTARARLLPLDLTTLSADTQNNLLVTCPNLKNENYEFSDLDCALRYLIANDQFDTADFVRSGNEHVKLEVGKTKRIIKIQFSGQKAFSDSELRKEFGLTEKTAFDQQLLLEAGERVRRLYLEHAYRNAIIDLEFQTIANSEINVLVKVTENAQTLIQAISIQCDNPDLKKDIERLLRAQVHEPYTEAAVLQIRNLAKSYYSMGRFYQRCCI